MFFRSATVRECSSVNYIPITIALLLLLYYFACALQLRMGIYKWGWSGTMVLFKYYNCLIYNHVLSGGLIAESLKYCLSNCKEL